MFFIYTLAVNNILQGVDMKYSAMVVKVLEKLNEELFFRNQTSFKILSPKGVSRTITDTQLTELIAKLKQLK